MNLAGGKARMNPHDKAHELARAIRESQEFRTMSDRKRLVEADVSAKKMLDEFRRRQWELETRRLMGETITEDDMEQIKRLHDAIQLHTVAREYLEAEYRFGIIYSDIQKILGDAVKDVVGEPA